MSPSLSLLSYTFKVVRSTMKGASHKKRLFYIGFTLILILLYNIVRTQSLVKDDKLLKSKVSRNSGLLKNSSTFKYILLWTNPKAVPFVYMDEGQKGFIDRKCPYQNCIVTGNRSFFSDYSKFDVIAFAGPQLANQFISDLPSNRLPHQKYVFASIESADNYPMCAYDGFFNWTWTYKLDSEVRWGYITIRDKNKKIVGPNKDMLWMKLEDMNPVSEKFKDQLKTKTKAAVWFVSNCRSISRREIFAVEMSLALKKYNLSVDIYGSCGTRQCPRSDDKVCDNIIKKTYYFYFSFENSFSEDYVTEKLLRALNNDAIPVVYGGANYSRFMPDGIYLNGRDLGAEATAAKMYELINDPEKYAEYFKWKNHYKYHKQSDSTETDPYCLFCSTLNDEAMVKKTTIYKEFRKWWDPPQKCLYDRAFFKLVDMFI